MEPTPMSNRTTWKQLSVHFPKVLAGEDLPPFPEHRILALFLAAHEGLPVGRWLRGVMADAIEDRARQFCAANNLQPQARVQGSLFGQTLAADGTGTGYPAGERSSLATANVFTLLELLDDRLDEIEKFAATHVPEKPKPRRGQHCLYTSTLREPTDPEKRDWFRQLIARGPMRPLARVTPRMLAQIEALHARAPNFAEAIRWVSDSLRMALHHGNRFLALQPILLVGPPGTGKTWFAEQVAKALGAHSVMLGLPSVTANWTLSGSSSSWKASEPGLIARMFMDAESRHASPMLILDELDKPTRGNYDPVNPLLALTDQRQAKRWRDEFFGLEFDVSKLIVVATANSIGPISEPLRTRFKVFRINEASSREMPAMVRSAWQEFRALHSKWRLPAELDEAIVGHLARRPAHGRALSDVFWSMSMRAGRRPGPLTPRLEDLEEGRRFTLIDGGNPAPSP
jgi:ATP-dependent Lon protease